MGADTSQPSRYASGFKEERERKDLTSHKTLELTNLIE
jgi:hypothetical protein